MIVWKGRGWWLPLIAVIAALLLLPVEPFFDHFGPQRRWLEAAFFCAVVAIGTLAAARILTLRDMKADKALTVKAAQALHGMYFISLTDWGYVMVLLACGLFVLANIPGLAI